MAECRAEETPLNKWKIKPVGSKNSCGLSVIEFQEATKALAGWDPIG